MNDWYWEYGWSSRFKDGEEYEWLGGFTQVEAQELVRTYQAEEDADRAELTYVVQRRKATKPGPWGDEA